MSERDPYDVIIVGAGLSGICGGYHLKKSCPHKKFVILERRDCIGGELPSSLLPAGHLDLLLVVDHHLLAVVVVVVVVLLLLVLVLLVVDHLLVVVLVVVVVVVVVVHQYLYLVVLFYDIVVV